LKRKKKKIGDLKKQGQAQEQREDRTPEKKSSGRFMIILATGFLFSYWFAFLYPWIKYQFLQSDTFWLIEVGRLILEKHCLPVHDPYSYTTTAAHWIIYQWLTEVIFSLAHSMGGLTGVSIFGSALLAVLFCLFIFRRMLTDGTNAIVALAAILFAGYSFFPGLSSLRPQLFSFMLFWLLVVACADCRKGLPIWKTLSRIFVIGVVWANCHISFLVGLLILAANTAGSLFLYVRKAGDKKLPIVFAAMFATFFVATFVTPYGSLLWSFLSDVQKVFYSQEVMPLAWTEQPVRLALAVVTLGSCLYLRKKLHASDFLAVLALFFVGANCGRLFVYFCIFSCPIIGTAATQLFQAQLNQGVLGQFSHSLKTVALSRFYVLAILLLSVLVVIIQPVTLQHNVPVQAAKFLESHKIAGNLFCTAHAGSYLIYSSHGAIPVFMDTRVDLYDPDLCGRFICAVYGAEHWKELFAQYKIASVLLPNETYIKLKGALDKQPEWKTIYKDDDFTLYAPNSEPPVK
jgi:hypothetical protein